MKKIDPFSWEYIVLYIYLVRRLIYMPETANVTEFFITANIVWDVWELSTSCQKRHLRERSCTASVINFQTKILVMDTFSAYVGSLHNCYRDRILYNMTWQQTVWTIMKRITDEGCVQLHYIDFHWHNDMSVAAKWRNIIWYFAFLLHGTKII